MLRFDFVRGPLRYDWPDPFTAKDVQPQPKFNDIKSKPPADLRYVIFFTPRSGSSYLTDLIRSAGTIGDAGEVFNPKIAAKVAGAMGSKSIEDYTDSIVRARNTDGVFGAEIVWTHLDFMFKDERQFLELVKPDRYVWLTRKDYIAQAVSIMSMGQTKLGHAKNVTDEEIAAARAAITYDAKRIKSAANRIVWMELQSEQFFKRHGITPLRLDYDSMMQTPGRDVLSRIVAHLGVEVTLPDAPSSPHRKLAGTKSAEFAERFRTEHKQFVKRMDKARASGRDTSLD